MPGKDFGSRAQNPILHAGKIDSFDFLKEPLDARFRGEDTIPGFRQSRESVARVSDESGFRGLHQFPTLDAGPEFERVAGCFDPHSWTEVGAFEGEGMGLSLHGHPFPQFLFQMKRDLGDVVVGGEEMFDDAEAVGFEGLGRVIVGEHDQRILHGVGGDDLMIAIGVVGIGEFAFERDACFHVHDAMIGFGADDPHEADPFFAISLMDEFGFHERMTGGAEFVLSTLKAHRKNGS